MFYKAEADMRREELEKKKNPKVDFVSGGTQPVTVVSAPKVIIPIPGPETILLLIQWDELAFRKYSFFYPIFMWLLVCSNIESFCRCFICSCHWSTTCPTCN